VVRGNRISKLVNAQERKKTYGKLGSTSASSSNYGGEGMESKLHFDGLERIPEKKPDWEIVRDSIPFLKSNR
jgi:hypothetical protein